MPRVRDLAQSDADAILPVTIGTALWAVALIALAFSRPQLEANGTLWWLWVAVVGFTSGAIGLVFLRWRKRRRNSDAGVAPGQE